MGMFSERAKVLTRLAGLAEWMAQNEDQQDTPEFCKQAALEAKCLRKRVEDLQYSPTVSEE